jgi:ankyrin repeat protein
MATIRISVNVANLWRTNVELKEGASWHDLKMEIKIATGICEIEQKLTPNDFDHVICELEDGDDVMCEINRNICHHHPLLCAAGFGNVEAIRSWIASGADVDVKSEFEDTPLLSASFHIEDKCIKELLHSGANVQHVNSTNDSALHYLVFGLIKWHHYDIQNVKNIIKMLIVAGIDLMTRNSDGLTAVELLQTHENKEFVKKIEEYIKEIVWQTIQTK